MPRLYFEPSARLQRFLGRELISDPNLAIVEFIKNAYDAGASEVYLEFVLADRWKGQQEILIWDDGVGMTLEEFKKHWMHPGFSYKSGASSARSTRRRSQAAIRQDQRVPVGEKGVGRLAAGRLGEQIEIYTRTVASDRWLHVTVDWSAFEDMNKPLNRVPIEYQYVDSLPDARYSTGTFVRISNLTLDWSGMVPGRKVAGRSDVRLGRLRQDLEILVAPLAQRGLEDFIVVLAADVQAAGNYLGPVTRETPRFIDYRYEFTIRQVGNTVVFDRSVHRSPDIAKRVGESLQTKIGADRYPAGEQPLRSGAFKGTFYYVPLSAKRWRDFGYPTGVHLYRDGVRVDPYGHGDDDWLGARARKATRQGYAPIQPNQLAGFVLISRGSNPNLVDMSNRQGLVENDASLAFLRYARLAFRDFEDLIFKEFVEPGWESPEEKIQAAAERSQRYTAAMLRSLVHSIRQPVAGLGAEMTSLRQIAEDPDIPQGVRKELLEVRERAVRHIDDIDSTLERYFGGAPEEDARTYELAAALQEAIDVTLPLAESLGVEVELDAPARRKVFGLKSAFVLAIANLVRNAIEAERPTRREAGRVGIRAEETDSGWRVTVVDNGTGIDPDIRDEILERPVSTKGRPGAGLLNARELLALSGCTLGLAHSDTDGAAFAVEIPSLRRPRGGRS